MVTNNSLNNVTPQNFKAAGFLVNTTTQYTNAFATIKGTGGAADTYYAVDRNGSTGNSGYNMPDSTDATHTWTLLNDGTTNEFKVDNNAVTKMKVNTTGELTTTAGITMSGSNTSLNNYSQGTWTPTISFGGGTTGITYSSQVGTYTRIGRFIFTTVLIVLTNKGSSTGALLINALPFTVNTSDQATPPRVDNITWVGNYLILQGFTGTTTGTLFNCTTTAAEAQLTDAAFANNSVVQGNFIYYT